MCTSDIELDQFCEGDNSPEGNHHWIPKRAGGTASNPVNELVCEYCGKTQAEVREGLK